jgi:SAM-dependent methyltransferase
MATVHGNERPDPAVVAYLKASGVDPAGVDLTVDGEDEMLNWALWAHQGCRQLALVNYFRCGLTAWRLLRDVLAWRFADCDDARILDFAAGYGRMTRFVVAERPAGSVSAAEIDPAAVEFQRRRFGVPAYPSGYRPEELAIGDRFDCVFAGSLFSHLPAPLFAAWLARLLARVAPGGVLVFSVHGEERMLPGRAMPAAGLYFEATSETATLDGAQYGTSWVREDFVAAAVSRAAPALAYRRLPRALWHSQDVYVVADSAAPLSALDPTLEPAGYLTACRRERDGSLVLAGWAADEGGGGPAAVVEVSVGRVRATAAVGEERPDVAKLLGDGFLRSGWSLSLRAPAGFAPDDLVVVAATTAGGVSAPLHASGLEVAALHLELADERARAARLTGELDRESAELRGVRVALGHESARVGELDRRVRELGWELQVLRSRIAAMETSFFWRLRNFWFALKHPFTGG